MKHVLLAIMLMALTITSANAADEIHYDGSSQVYWAFVKDTIDMFTTETGIKVIAEDRKTQDAIPSLISGRCNIGGLARKMTPAEKSQGDDIVETLMAKDHIAIFVSSNSKINQISFPDVKKVFSGEITNWKDLGDEPGDIVVVIPQAKTACNKNFTKIIMGNTPFATSSIITETAGAVLEQAKNKRAISFISYGALTNKPEYKIMKVDNKAPGADDYPIAQEFYFVTKGSPSGITKKYIDFFLIGAGKEHMKKSGLIMVN